MVFYIWLNDDEGGYGICRKDQFDDLFSIVNFQYPPYTTSQVSSNIIFEFTSRDEFISKFIENDIGDKNDADFYINLYKDYFN